MYMHIQKIPEQIPEWSKKWERECECTKEESENCKGIYTVTSMCSKLSTWICEHTANEKRKGEKKRTTMIARLVVAIIKWLGRRKKPFVLIEGTEHLNLCTVVAVPPVYRSSNFSPSMFQQKQNYSCCNWSSFSILQFMFRLFHAHFSFVLIKNFLNTQYRIVWNAATWLINIHSAMRERLGNIEHPTGRQADKSTDRHTVSLSMQWIVKSVASTQCLAFFSFSLSTYRQMVKCWFKKDKLPASSTTIHFSNTT